MKPKYQGNYCQAACGVSVSRSQKSKACTQSLSNALCFEGVKAFLSTRAVNQRERLQRVLGPAQIGAMPPSQMSERAARAVRVLLPQVLLPRPPSGAERRPLSRRSPAFWVPSVTVHTTTTSCNHDLPTIMSSSALGSGTAQRGARTRRRMLSPYCPRWVRACVCVFLVPVRARVG